MNPLFWLLGALAAVFVLIAIKIFKKGSPKDSASDGTQNDNDKKEDEEIDQRRRVPRGRTARARLIEGRRRAERDDVEFDENEAQDMTDKAIKGKFGTKKLRKLEEKEERKARREQEEAAREDRKKREELRREHAKEKEEEEEIQQQEQEEKARQERLRREEEEQKEYERLKEFFSVDTEGSGETDIMQESDTLLQDFIDYIKTQKVVLLEDLAAHFHLKTQDAINRIHALEELGRLTGVVDDRGKFIYISEEELNKVAKFIRQRGRVSIADLAESSNSLIELQPSN
ncbi:DDRGK domain-containing protein 1-like [Oscarella lobularis]|uniref:DDRGK domain-containing protein 1-like n=1 Tax=Oscarella lobularis TaxID=121494 RepID=UPI0033131C19